MADSELLALGERTALALTDNVYVVDNPGGGAEADWRAQLAFLLGQLLPAICQGRLTTESGVPVSTSDRTSQGTIYFTPYHGNRVSLYNGTAWKAYVFTERSLALTVTSGSNYDVFLYDNAGTLTLELSAAWTDDTTRVDALTTQDGIAVKSGATTRRHVGTIRASGSNVIEDSAAKRFVWNRYNQVSRMMSVSEGTDSWTYTTGAFRQANGSAANQLDYVTGDAATLITAEVHASHSATNASANPLNNIGIDSTSTPSANQSNATHQAGTGATNLMQADAYYKGYPGLGRHKIVWLEGVVAAVGTVTWYGDAQGISGISGVIWN